MEHFKLKTINYIQLHNDFNKFIFVRNYGRGRATAYQSCIKEFLFKMEEKGIKNLKQVKVGDIVEHYEYLTTRKNLKREGKLSFSMIKHHLYSLRVFFDYLVDTDVIPNSPARLPKFMKGEGLDRNVCTLKEIGIIFKNCITQSEKAIIAFGYGCGLRRSEIRRLNIPDLKINGKIVVIRDSKFSKSRIVPVSNKMMVHIKKFILNEREKNLKRNSKQSTQSLFVNTLGNRMSGTILNQTVKTIVARTNNPELKSKNITLHCLRHSIATHLLDNGADVEFVQNFLGHTEIDTVLIYAKRRKQKFKIGK